MFIYSYLRLIIISSNRRIVCRVVCLYTFGLVRTNTRRRSYNSTFRLLEIAMHLHRVLPVWLRLRIRGENESARGGVLPIREADRRQFQSISTLPRLFPMTSPYRPLDFPMGMFSEHHKFAYHPTCHLLFLAGSTGCKRQRRGTRYGLVERSVVEIGEELAFSGNFPVAPCANIYREYRDLRELLYARVRLCCNIRTCTHSYTRIQTQSYCAWKPQYASGNCVNTCIKISAFACLHPRPRYPPSGPLARSLSYLLCCDSRVCMPTYHDDDVIVDVIVARVYGAKMSSDLERASRMLTFPARRGMITLMTYIGGSAIMYPRRHRFYSSRETVDADAR